MKGQKLTARQERELYELITKLLDAGLSRETILAGFTKIAEEYARERSLLVKPQPPAVKAGNMDV